MGTVIALLFVVMFFAGIAGVIKPRIIRLNHRRHGAALIAGSFILVAIGGDFFPAPGAVPAEPMLLPLLTIYGLAGGLYFIGRQIHKYSVRERSAPQPPPDAARDRQGGGRQTSDVVERETAYLRKLGQNARQTTPAGQPSSLPRSEALSDRGRGVGDILQEGKPKSILRFEYADEHGEITDRSVTKWVEYERHIEGVCLSRKSVRLFRKDRVIEWIDGNELLIRTVPFRSARR